jgi:hypothetical protein
MATYILYNKVIFYLLHNLFIVLRCILVSYIFLNPLLSWFHLDSFCKEFLSSKDLISMFFNLHFFSIKTSFVENREYCKV